MAAGVVAAITAPLGPAISGMFAGMTYGAIMGGFEGGWKGALIGAGVGAFMGANIGLGIQTFGQGFGYAALGAATIYTAATEGADGLAYMAGGMMGSMVGYQAAMAIRGPPIDSIAAGTTGNPKSKSNFIPDKGKIWVGYSSEQDGTLQKDFKTYYDYYGNTKDITYCQDPSALLN